MSKSAKLVGMIRARWMMRHHSVGRRVTIAPGTFLGFDGDVTIGDRVSISRGVGIGMNGQNPTLKIGDRTYIQSRTRIHIRESVEIGTDCAISWDVDIMDTDFHGIVHPDGSTPSITAPVSIEDRVWIGTGAKILKGVRIGHDSVVAAGAVVTRSFPPHSLIGGVPARRLKEIRGWTK